MHWFKCTPPAIDCCCHHILYNQPDFTHVETTLETYCKNQGFQVISLPKFHCELNFIKQCWGYTKRLYCLNPESLQEAIAALNVVPLESMCRFANHSRWFMDVYQKGLNGSEAAWASRKYCGHHVLPESLMEDMEKAKLH
ncbi:uncharacterized protein LACBIDRAFT_312113 [Laccaria bicolor S238N-H82]|uniref:Predicted protein n=1 Tax=Laccaria bicolor (strain S238N-H82 / ATCC MYA-4686) TaxID=486041 RepID=B0CZ41_LACBS|nr:uncharacterized protein LACBIDRAFT_312113 [Laccaria bicolor S238N-H82]EDR12555.1 predicted protein [Laccaria bicolor S238N-H82]|eukprot:XP_001876819.1 predicted protein [Laccaria bicolor S238N-H82]